MRSSLVLFIALAVTAGFGLSLFFALKTSDTDVAHSGEVQSGAEKETGRNREPRSLAELLPPPHGFGTPERVNAGVIGIAFASRQRPDISRSREAAEELAHDIRAKIFSSGISFRQAAIRYSDHESSKKGGSLGFVRVEEIAHLPGSSIIAGLKPGDISPVFKGESGFFIYTRIPYEPVYAKIRYFPYGTADEGMVSKGKARSEAYKLYSSISAGSDPFKGPEGYIGEVVPAGGKEKLHSMLSAMKTGDVHPPYDTGTGFVLFKRCRPIQFTFSYIVFPGETGAEETKNQLVSRAEESIHQIRGRRKEFYRRALSHHKKIRWDASWYKISKDLYNNRVSGRVYEFLSSSSPGDISGPLIFANGVYILMKEEDLKKIIPFH